MIQRIEHITKIRDGDTAVHLNPSLTPVEGIKYLYPPTVIPRPANHWHFPGAFPCLNAYAQHKKKLPCAGDSWTGIPTRLFHPHLPSARLSWITTSHGKKKKLINMWSAKQGAHQMTMLGPPRNENVHIHQRRVELVWGAIHYFSA